MQNYKIEDGITQSLLQNWLNCRESAYLSIQGWRPKTGSIAMEFGTLMHKLLEHLYGGKTKDEDPFIMILAWKKEMLAKAFDVEKIEHHSVMARAFYIAYARYYMEKDEHKDWLQLEQVFDVQWQSFRLRGRIDGVYKIKNKLWILETKTAGQIPESLDDSLILSLQNQFYIVALEQSTGQKVAGVLYNIIRKPSIRQRQNEDKADFMQRMEADITERSDFYFRRIEVVYSEKQIELFKEQLWAMLKEFKNWIQDTGSEFVFHYRNPGACVSRGSCKYLRYCASGGKDPSYTQDREMFSELKEDPDASEKKTKPRRRRAKSANKKKISRH